MITSAQLIDVKLLRTFMSVAKHKSVTLAAQSLFMTQPAVSQHIKKVEEKLGYNVFNRSDGFQLTHEGTILLKYATESFEIYENLYRELNENKKQYRIAISNLFCPNLVDKILKRFQADFDLCITHYTPFGINQSDIFDEYDMVLSVNMKPTNPGRAINIKRSGYRIISTNNNLEKPQKAIYFNSLSKEEVMDILTDNNIDSSGIENWLSTSSTKIIKNDMASENCIIICPDYISLPECYEITRLRNPGIDLYVWFNEKSLMNIQHVEFVNTFNSLQMNPFNLH